MCKMFFTPFYVSSRLAYIFSFKVFKIYQKNSNFERFSNFSLALLKFVFHIFFCSVYIWNIELWASSGDLILKLKLGMTTTTLKWLKSNFDDKFLVHLRNSLVKSATRFYKLFLIYEARRINSKFSLSRN